MVRCLWIAVGIFGCLFPLCGQEGGGTGSLRRGIDNLTLGKSLEEIQEALPKSPYFMYRGPKDVSFLPLKPEPVIDTEGIRYIQRGLFQFREGKLIAIILFLNPKYMDYPTLMKHFTTRYGPPAYLDPKSCYWEDRQTRVSLEKPLTVKFIDRGVLAKKDDAEKALPHSPEEEGRRRFLELF